MRIAPRTLHQSHYHRLAHLKQLNPRIQVFQLPHCYNPELYLTQLHLDPYLGCYVLEL